MLGYMAAKQAKDVGFTHHGSYYGIPCWVAPDKDFMVATKWAPMEYLMSAGHVIEAIVREFLYPFDDPCFQFKVGEEIK